MPVCAVCGHDVGQGAQGQRVVEGQLFAGQHLGGGLHADHGHVEDPEDVRSHEVIQSETRLLSPLMTEEMVITVVTPMTMPRMVSPERSLFALQRVERQLDRFAGLPFCHKD